MEPSLIRHHRHQRHHCRKCEAMAMVIMAAILFLSWPSVDTRGQYDWLKYDNFDAINDQITSVNAKNCRSKSRDQLVLRSDAVSQLPVYNQLLSRTWYKNRTTLIHIHNMALNRAFFFSYVLQRMNDTTNFKVQPNWMYFYFSTVSDIFANPGLINASSIYFDNDCHYPNWFTTVSFNNTLPLFAAKAYRWNDYRDMDNPIRETTGRSAQVLDAGARKVTNYTHPNFKMNPWYPNWLPDMSGALDSFTKFTYYVGIKYSNETGKFISDAFESFAFAGPASPSARETDKRKLPVIFPPPYFDCGGSNKWVVSAVSPIVDFMPRYSNWTHMRRQRFVAAVVVDTDFNKVDFNACGVSPGNPGPSYLSGISRCRKTTGCKHKNGYGFRRGGYVCVCKPGRAYPWWLDPPFQGESVEQATRKEYFEGFQCSKTNYRQVMPVIERLNGDRLKDLQRRLMTDFNKKKNSNNNNNNNNDQTENVNVKVKRSVRSGEEPVIELFHADNATHITGYAVTNGDDVRRHMIPRDNYVAMNDVTVDVEKLYQADVNEHQKLRESLFSESKSLNFSTVKEALLTSIIDIRDRHVERFLSHRRKSSPLGRHKRASVFDEHANDRMMRILRRHGSVTSQNCHLQPAHMLHLPGDVTYGVWKQFEVEGRTALRLAHFLSMYLQNSQVEEHFGNLRGGGLLHIDQMFGEVIANVMGNFKIYSSGIFFDRNKFMTHGGTNRNLFGPWAYRKGKGAFFAIDSAGLPDSYLDQAWFRKMKSRFVTNFKGIKQYKIRPFVRSDSKGTSTVKHEFFPLFYKAPGYKSGSWSSPHFRCDGKVNAWVMTYSTPFFGLDPIRSKLEFKGVVTIDVPLNKLQIHQCPQPFRVANAFKNTARCDYLSTKCQRQSGFPFTKGSYRCVCRLGFEYWHNDGKFWMAGALMESEYDKKMAGLANRFDLLRCRVASAPSSLSQNVHGFVALMAIFVIWIQDKQYR